MVCEGEAVLISLNRAILEIADKASARRRPSHRCIECAESLSPRSLRILLGSLGLER